MSQSQVRRFLEQQALQADAIDLDYEVDRLIENMLSGLAHEQEALNMIPTYIEVGRPIATDETVIVMDAGGTNFRVATLRFDADYKPVIEHYQTFDMPGSHGPISRIAFFDRVVDILEPVLGQSRRIGFCFSYATEIYPNRDGRVLNFSKEIELPEVVGTLIGDNIREALERRGLDSDIEIAILNDTVAALLGGVSQTQGRDFESYIGFILGTGTNTAYTEQVSAIGKLGRPDDQGRMIINMESGSYPIATRSVVDEAIDRDTVMPGTYLFEKVISGRYQGLQLWHTLGYATEAGLFSPAFVRGFAGVTELDSMELDHFLFRPQGDNRLANLCQTDDDRLNLYYLIDNLFERAARLATVNLAAVMKHMDAGRNPLHPVGISAEGTTFYKAKLLKPKIDLLMATYTNQKLGLYHEFIRGENSNLIGAAIAALTNL